MTRIDFAPRRRFGARVFLDPRPTRVGIEPSGSMQWFLELIVELGIGLPGRFLYCKIVTSALSSVVRIIENSTGCPSSEAIPVSVCRFRLHPPFSAHAQTSRIPGPPKPNPWRRRLIANLELKLRVNPIGINELKFSNRKFLAILRSASRIPSLFEPQGSGFESLIENARLRSRLSP